MDINLAKRIFVKNFESPKETLLKLSENIINIVEVDGTKYVTYILQNRVGTLKDNKGVKVVVKELLIADYDRYKVKQLKRCTMTIYEYFDSVEKYKVGYINGKLYEPMHVKHLQTIANRFPKEDVLLNLNSKK